HTFSFGGARCRRMYTCRKKTQRIGSLTERPVGRRTATTHDRFSLLVERYSAADCPNNSDWPRHPHYSVNVVLQRERNSACWSSSNLFRGRRIRIADHRSSSSEFLRTMILQMSPGHR